MAIWSDLKDAVERAWEEGGTVQGWMDYFNARDFLIVLAIVAFAWMAVTAATEKYFCDHVLDEQTIVYENQSLKAKCKECGHEIVYPAIVEVPPQDNVEPTCMYDGVYTELWTFEFSTKYQHRYVKTLPKLNHIVATIVEERVEPTCLDKGKTEKGICAMCYREIGGEEIPALGHGYEIVGYVKPTCTAVGHSGIEVCSRCDHTQGVDQILPMTEHEGISGTFEATYGTCGYTGVGCKNCAYPMSIDQVHSEPLVSQYFTYEVLSENNGVIITSVVKAEKEMTIPDAINGYDVIMIGEGLFQNNTVLEKINLPARLEEIHINAFNNCVNLKELKIPNSTKYIGINAFNGCTNLLTVDLGEGVRNVESDAFLNCPKILSFRFPSNYDLEEYYFDFTYSVPVLYGPKKLYGTDYHGSAYLLLPNYTYFHKSTDKGNYIIEENGYYFYMDKEHKVLLLCEENKIKDNTLFVPDGTNIIHEDFFIRLRNITSIVLPRSVYQIMESRWDKDSWDVVFPQVGYNHLNVYYYGIYEEYDFIDLKLLTPYAVDANADYRFYCQGEWTLNNEGLPVLSE